MKIPITRLRTNIYQILDGIIKTGKEIEIERNGFTLKISPTQARSSKLANLKKRKATSEPAENFTHVDWSQEWKQGKQKKR